MKHRYGGNSNLVPLWSLVCVLVATAGVPGEDRVRWQNDRGERIEWRGEIVAYTAREVQLKNAAGRVVKASADRLLQVTYDRSEAHQQADALLAAGEFDQAAEKYQAAFREEARSWVKEELAASLVRCQMSLNQPTSAAKIFLAIVTENSESRFWPVIPLTWTADVPADARRGPWNDWLHDKRPAARLLAASWLWAGNQQAEAETTLRELLRDESATVRQLAAAQQWRGQIVRANVADVERWDAEWREMPDDLRGGPAVSLAQAWQRLERTDDAVLAYLLAAWHPYTPAPLATECRTAAARLLREQGHEDEAARLQTRP